jgi:hypothetical protein
MVADNPKSRISYNCSKAAELKLPDLNQKTLQNFQARFTFVQLSLDLKLRAKGVSKIEKFLDWKI